MSHILMKYLPSLWRVQACPSSSCLASVTAARAVGGSRPLTDEAGAGAGAGEEEREKDPHLLHAVWRIRSLKKRPFYERNIMKQLQLADTKMNTPVIHKNTPQVNMLLTRVRHLVRIQPINPVYGLPDGDYDETLLKWNGEFIVKRKIDAYSGSTTSLSDGVKGV